MPSLTLHFVLITGAMAVALVGCGQGAAPTVAQPPPEVGVLTLTTQTVPVVNELPGRVAAPRVAEVRARAAGILLKREFNEGTDVQAGEVLFRIDPAPMQAAHSSAQANLARAEATLTAVKVKVERLQPLLGTNAISKQDYDDAVAARDQSVADVAAAKAALATAQLNLDYTVVTAPISGRIGRALVTEGALVGQNEATPLAMIQQLDPIHVNLTRPSTELLRLQNDIASGRLSAIEQPTVTMIAPDGRPLPQAGRLVFTEALVDPTTDAVIIRAEFPNPDHLLLPGMYLRARVGQALAKDAIVVPQQAVNRKPEGATVLVLGPEDKLIERKVRVEGTHGNGYVVSEGLKAGERVVVDGLQKARPGISVKAMVWEPPKTGDPATTARTSSAN